MKNDIFPDFNPDEMFIFNYRIKKETSLKALLTERYKRNMLRNDQDIDHFVLQRIRVNGKVSNLNTNLEIGDKVNYLHLKEDEAQFLGPLFILYEDDFIIAIEKPIGLPITPSIPYYFNSIVNLLRVQEDNPNLSPLHRLDMDTTGVLLFYKDKSVVKHYHDLFRENLINKYYSAIVFGNVDPSNKYIEGRIVNDGNSLIYSKYKLVDDNPNSFTEIVSINHIGNYSELRLKPKTGKTNQIRIHLAQIGHSIVGDKKYYEDESIYINWFKNDDFDDRMITKNHILNCDCLNFIDHEGKDRTIRSNRYYYKKSIDEFKKITKL